MASQLECSVLEVWWCLAALFELVERLGFALRFLSELDEVDCYVATVGRLVGLASGFASPCPSCRTGTHVPRRLPYLVIRCELLDPQSPKGQSQGCPERSAAIDFRVARTIDTALMICESSCCLPRLALVMLRAALLTPAVFRPVCPKLGVCLLCLAWRLPR